MIRRALFQTSSTMKRKVAELSSFFRPPTGTGTNTNMNMPRLQLQLAGASIESGTIDKSNTSTRTGDPTSIADCLWLAVPKRKVTPGKKRMKTTNQKRIKRKNHIIVDGRTGETTLRHRLPFNWKEYLTGN